MMQMLHIINVYDTSAVIFLIVLRYCSTSLTASFKSVAFSRSVIAEFFNACSVSFRSISVSLSSSLLECCPFLGGDSGVLNKKE